VLPHARPGGVPWGRSSCLSPSVRAHRTSMHGREVVLSGDLTLP
jgi:hypothetical protein